MSKLRVIFEAKFHRLYGTDFESWIVPLLKEAHVPYSSIRTEVGPGDGGIDLAVVNQCLVYAIYAPITNSSRGARKIHNDFARAKGLLDKHDVPLKRWIFVHNLPCLNKKAVAAITNIGNQPGIVKAGDMGGEQLWQFLQDNIDHDTLEQLLIGSFSDQTRTSQDLHGIAQQPLPLWNAFNHSNPKVPFSPLSEPAFNTILRHLKEVYNVRGVLTINWIQRAGSSVNFQVICSEQSYLLRAEFRMNKFKAVKELRALTQFLNDELSKDFPQLAHLKPIPPKKERALYWPGGLPFPNSGQFITTLMPYFPHRYQIPRNSQEVCNVALLFGAYINALNRYAPSKMAIVTSRRKDLENREQLNKDWHAAIACYEACELSPTSVTHAVYRLMLTNQHLGCGLEPYSGSTEQVVTYRDLHPHNILQHESRREELLICDLESCVVSNGHEPSVAFAAHRIVRELAIASEDPMEVIDWAIPAFFEKLELDDYDSSILERVGAHVTRMNLSKALVIFEQFRGEYDIGSTIFDTPHFFEMQKLLTYAAEGHQITAHFEKSQS